MLSKKTVLALIILSFVITITCLTVESVSATQPGEKPPGFNLSDALTGKSVKLSEYEGKIILLDFFATWCGHCRHAIDEELVPLWNQHYAEIPNVVFLSVDIWEEDASAQDLQKFAESHGIRWPILMGSGSGIDKDYTIEGVPTLLIIGQEGLVKHRHLGSPGLHKIREEIGSLLDSSPPSVSIKNPADGTVLKEDTVTVGVIVSDETNSENLSVTVEGSEVSLTDGYLSKEISLEPGSNTITVTAEDPEGNTNSAEAEVIRDVESPSISIKTPEDGTKTEKDKITVSGSVIDDVSKPEDIKLSAAGNSVNAQSNGSFSVTLNLTTGKNSFTFIATDSVGRHESKEFTITKTNINVKLEEQDIKKIGESIDNLELSGKNLSEKVQRLKNAVYHGWVGLSLSVRFEDRKPKVKKEYQHRDIQIEAKRVIAGKKIAFKISSEVENGKIIVLNIDKQILPDPSEAEVLYDNNEVELADNYRDALNPSNESVDEYLILTGEKGSHILISIPKFSTHTITITEKYSINTSVRSGKGSISLQPSKEDYEKGTEVTITANPSSGYKLDRWSGDFSGTSKTKTVTVDSDINLIAHFTEKEGKGSGLPLTWIGIGISIIIILTMVVLVSRRRS